jgi:type IV secretory pathway TraG/TraD family ATPase VirD4
MKRQRVLVVVDEAYMLGHDMKILENCMGMGAGAAGIQLWCLFQDISQIRGMFKDTWETFIQNCGVTMWFGARDQSTREYVSKLAGTCEVISRSAAASKDRLTGEVVVSQSGGQFSRPLIHPQEVGVLTDDRVHMIAFVEGVNGPIFAKRKPYWLVSKFRGKFRKNPYANDNHGGLLRRLVG